MNRVSGKSATSAGEGDCSTNMLIAVYRRSRCWAESARRLAAGGMISLLLATPFAAQTAPTADEICGMFREFAENAMTVRLGGVSMADYMSAIGEGLNDPEAGPLVREIILQAWEYPSLVAKDRVDDVIRDFADRHMIACYRRQAAG